MVQVSPEIQNHKAEEEAYSMDEDDWIPDRLHSIQQKINLMGTKSKNGPQFYSKTLLGNNRQINFNVETPVTPVIVMPKIKFNSITPMRPVREDYRDVNDNKIKFKGETTANNEIDGKIRQLELLITTKQNIRYSDSTGWENWA